MLGNDTRNFNNGMYYQTFEGRSMPYGENHERLEGIAYLTREMALHDITQRLIENPRKQWQLDTFNGFAFVLEIKDGNETIEYIQSDYSPYHKEDFQEAFEKAFQLAQKCIQEEKDPSQFHISHLVRCRYSICRPKLPQEC